MKIKQQNQIKTFLIEEFGVDSGNTLFEKQEKILNEIIKNTKNKSKKQMETLIQTILPRIALYKALKEEFDEDLVCYDFSNWWDNMDDIEQVKEYRKHE